MKTGFIALTIAGLLALSAHISTALGQGATAFTYQGQLLNNGSVVNGTNGIIFTLYSAATGNNAVGNPITNSVAVSNGVFTVNLDFGAGAFNGSARWLGVGVSNGTLIQDLSPRTQVLPAPYATFAATAVYAGTASNLTGGVVNSTVVQGNVIEGSFFGNGSGLTNVAANLQMEVFSTPGTYYFTLPTNVSSIIVEAWGGGGMGGSGSGTYDVCGGGGGAGGYTKISYNDLSPGSSYQVVVGVGGASGAPNGGNSEMGGIILATGGTAGSAPSSTSHAAGGAGGTGVGASSTASSTQGGTGKYGTPTEGGDGGDAPCGGPGGVGNIGSGAEAGHAPGGGGGGGEYSGTVTGGAGANGEVIVYY